MIARYVIIFLFCVSKPMIGHTADPDPAYGFVQEVSGKALQIIQSEISPDDKEKKLSALFIESVDTQWIARFVMGRYWREASKAQQEKYLKAHEQFLLNNYIPKFREYTNQQVKILKSYPSGKSKQEYMVETQLVSKDGTAVSINYKIKKTKDGKYRIFDMIAEGVSLIITQRADFASILSRGGIEELILKLDKKT